MFVAPQSSQQDQDDSVWRWDPKTTNDMVRTVCGDNQTVGLHNLQNNVQTNKKEQAQSKSEPTPGNTFRTAALTMIYGMK